jgi:predicted hydrolase (HD superfamily)
MYRCAGLLHDFDYDRHPTPEEHPFVGVKYLREQGWPEEMLHAILAHADYSGVLPETHLDKALFASDELAGFLTACALVKPSKAIAEVEVAGVKKKMKDKAFARAVKREDITRGAELLGIPVEEHIGNCLRAMQEHAAELGLCVPIVFVIVTFGVDAIFYRHDPADDLMSMRYVMVAIIVLLSAGQFWYGRRNQ